MKHLLKDETVMAILATLTIHLCLLLVALWLRVDFRPVVAEFVELSFAGVRSQDKLEATSALQPSPVESRRPLSSPFAEEQDLRPEVNLPERRELALPEETLLENVHQVLERAAVTPPSEKLRPFASVPATPRRPEALDAPILKHEKTMPAELFNRQLTQRPVEATPRVAAPLREDFEIDWQGNIQREIYQKRLPEFPPGVQREATIRIQFTVLPNGLVGSTLLLQKGDTQLENLTLEAFKTWRFNPLPPSVPQTEQSGIITFHFKLK